ncbi:MAG: glycoside hydrolase family 13 protein [Clostridia bacterium]|nr:glycoside hydrolase family 13 protein [Clostridia bacterium]
MYAEFDPALERYKRPVGGASVNKAVEFSVVTNAPAVSLLVRKDGEEYIEFPAKKAGNCFTARFSSPDAGLYFYRFSLCGEVYGMPCGGYASAKYGSLEKDGGEFSLTLFKEGYSTPEWIKGGVIYQIFPDRFFRADSRLPNKNGILREWGGVPEYRPVNGKTLNNDFFGGDFKGIEAKLDYLQALGVTAIYLNPIFEARSNHRYDTGDYEKTDCLLGDENDLKNLILSARSRGIALILDGVFNHTGDDSLYFNKYGNYESVGAYNSKDSPYYKWYDFRSYPNEYECWWGVDTLPQVNEAEPSFIDYICGINGVLGRYLRLGAMGWRLDVVDELPAPFVRHIRQAVKDFSPDAVVIGEVWENVTDKISYGVRREYFCGEELDSAMNYPLKNAIINFLTTFDSSEIVSVIRRQTDCYPPQSLNCLMNILGTHDTPRIINLLSGRKMPATRGEQAFDEPTEEEYSRGVEMLKIAATIEYTLYGVPALYYGDEVGLTGWADPFNRRCMPWGRSSPLTEHYKKLGRIRRENSVFKDGATRIFYVSPHAFGFTREKGNEIIYVAANLGAETPVFTFNGNVTDLFTGEKTDAVEVPYGQIRVVKEII